MASFHDMEEVHRTLEEQFARHQDALVERDVERARRILVDYTEALHAHMRDEEDALMPVYSERVGEVPGGSPQMILDEHKKLLELLGEIAERTEQLSDDSLTTREIVALIDVEHRYKGLVEHHHLREHNIFYPKLDAATTATEREKILAATSFGREPVGSDHDDTQ